jgi:hypothetical protein
MTVPTHHSHHLLTSHVEKLRTHNGRVKFGKPGAQKVHKGTTLTPNEVEEKIKSGKYKHTIEKIGSGKGGLYHKIHPGFRNNSRDS